MKITIDDTAVKEMIARIEGKNDTRPFDLRAELKGLTNFLLQKEILKAKLRDIENKYPRDYEAQSHYTRDHMFKFLLMLDKELAILYVNVA